MERHLVTRTLALTLSLFAAACGKTANILTSPLDGGVSGSGGGPSAAGGQNGGTRNDGGALGAGAAGSGIDGGTTLLDPHRQERRALVDQICNNLSKHPCLSLSETVGENGSLTGVDPTAECVRQLNYVEYTGVPEACWDEWVLAARCAATASYECPCNSVSDCSPDPLSNGHCPNEASALSACLGRHPSSTGTVSGTHFKGVLWQLSTDQTSCKAFVTDPDPSMDLTHDWSVNCTGAPGGPYSCSVLLNGRIVVDDRAQDGAFFLADDCQAAAQRFADGFGTNFVDCCFTWFPAVDAGPGTNGQHCSCTVDPTANGPQGPIHYNSCAELVAGEHGHAVDLCPYYAPVDNGTNFPAP